ncbi:serine/threonine-protein phosphatase rdgC-like [Teleopsis dalmanni]|uniref:serine/threonine-protein phosphatase rdgC-like n=1 Tax=Teleopsis dalmanni TaxID=139649 RepID=UPI0018CDE508|nr:serine/threonine-protein phosphatase rdgC-like [Teleopsis dalmanni]
MGEKPLSVFNIDSVFDIMWSDPQHSNGCIPNTLRGAGTYFGPNITEQFLSDNNFKYLVRSHECKPDGHEFTHNNKVITIFSASNYYAIGSNKGAYLQIGTNLQPHFVQYISAASKTSALTIRQRVSFIESSAIRALGARIRDKRTLLEAEFRKHDPKHTGIISITKWCYIMEKETNLTLPWRLLRDKLAPMPEGSPPNDVNYLVTLEILDSDIIIETQKEETSVAESLYRNKSSLVAIFSILDKDSNGVISIDEFKETCTLLQKHIQNSSAFGNMFDKFKMMDLNKDGFIDLNEFLEAFRLSDQANKSNTLPSHKKQIRGQNHDSVKQVTKSLARQISEPEVIDPTDFTSK